MKISSTGFMTNIEIPKTWHVYVEGVLDVGVNAYFMASGDLTDEYGNRIYSFIRFSEETSEYTVFGRKPDPDTLEMYSTCQKLRNVGFKRDRDKFTQCGSYKDHRLALLHARLVAAGFQAYDVEDIREYRGIVLRGDFFNLDIIMAIALMRLVKRAWKRDEGIDFFIEPENLHDSDVRPVICFIGGYNLSTDDNEVIKRQLENRQTCYFEALWIRYLEIDDVLNGISFLLSDSLLRDILPYKYTNGNGLYEEGVTFKRQEIYGAVDRAYSFMKEKYRDMLEDIGRLDCYNLI